MLAIWLATLPASADIPLGTPIQDAVAIDITQRGLGTLTNIAAGLVPSLIPVDDITAFECVQEVFGVCLASYEFQVLGVWVEVEFDSLALIPGPNNTLALDGLLTVRVNDPIDPIYIFVEGEALGIGISDTCDAYVRDFQVAISATVGVDLVNSLKGKVLDFTVGTPTWSWTLDESDIIVTGSSCDIDTINSITSFFGYDLIEILIEQVEPEIDALVLSLPALLEPTLNDALPSLSIIETIDVLGVPIEFQIEPSELTIDPAGLRIALVSRVEAPVADCIAPFLEDMVDTPSSLPAIGLSPAGLGFSPDVNAMVDDDFVNQVLYALWAGGVLCVDADTDLGLPIPTSTLAVGLLPAEEFDGLFPIGDMKIAITPTEPPRFTPAGSSDINIDLNGMGIGFFHTLDARQVRVANVNLNLGIGTDLEFDGNTGELAVAIDLAGADIVPNVDFNEYFPATTAAIEEKVPATINGLLPFLNPLLEGLVFGIPNFEGVGVAEIGVEPAGPTADRLGMYARVDQVSYVSAGCEDGCSSSGCSTNGIPGQTLILLTPLLIAGLRRRNS